jgi:hypothetical protein
MEITLDNRLELLTNGNCPKCNYKIRIGMSGGTIYKGRLFIMYKSKQVIEIKCPKCKMMLVDHN